MDRVANLTQVIMTKSKQNLASNLLITYYTTPNRCQVNAQNHLLRSIDKSQFAPKNTEYIKQVSKTNKSSGLAHL
jgi:hypothetical protein